MTQYPPPFLNPQPPLQPAGRPVLQFVGGLGSGLLLSGALWAAVYLTSLKDSDGTIILDLCILTLVIKLAGGITFLCIRGSRLIGGGVLVSLAFGLLTAFGIFTYMLVSACKGSV